MSNDNRKSWEGRLALIVSGIAVWFTYNNFEISKDLSERDQFRELVIKIAEERNKVKKASPCYTVYKPAYRTSPQNDNVLEVMIPIRETGLCYGHISRSISQAPPSFSTELVIVYFHEAADIEPSIESLVTPTEYLILADMAFAHSGLNSANKYANKALSRAKENGDSTSVVSVLQALADMKYNNSPQTSVDEGRQHYREAVDTLSALSSNDKSQYAEAGLWLSWAIAEASAGETSRADENFEKAKEVISSSSYEEKQKQMWILNARTQLIEMASKSGRVPSEWRNENEKDWIRLGQKDQFNELDWDIFPIPDRSSGKRVPEPREIEGTTPRTYADEPSLFDDKKKPKIEDSGFGAKKYDRTPAPKPSEK